MNPDPRTPTEPDAPRARAVGTTGRLVLSIAEAAEALGLSDDLLYELTERGELPCLRFGRRKVIPRQAIELVIQHALAHFDPEVVAGRLVVASDGHPTAGPAYSTQPVPSPARGNGRTARSPTRRPGPVHQDAAPSVQMGMLFEGDGAARG